ncbi:MAG: universal stress protein [Gemmatimonadetes bacterium]|nr:universal stress protein [Gemmatimonadota bacterium]
MYDRILVPVDRSAFSERAIPHGERIASRTGAELHLVMVHSVAGMSFVPRGPVALDTRLDHDLARDEQDYLDQLATRIRDKHDLPVTTTLLDGPLSRTIQCYIRDHDIDLIVMTTHGRGGLRRAWLGSVADRLVRHSHVPILLIRPIDDDTPAIEHTRVLVALDGSPIADAALERATALFGLHAHATLLNVVVPPIGPASPYLPDAARLNLEEVERETEKASRLLATAADRVCHRWLGVRTRLIRAYHPADAILRAARTEDADLIAMGTHGRGPFVRAILGSVADRVVRGADRPVFVSPAHVIEPPRPAVRVPRAENASR